MKFPPPRADSKRVLPVGATFVEKLGSKEVWENGTYRFYVETGFSEYPDGGRRVFLRVDRVTRRPR